MEGTNLTPEQLEAQETQVKQMFAYYDAGIKWIDSALPTELRKAEMMFAAITLAKTFKGYNPIDVLMMSTEQMASEAFSVNTQGGYETNEAVNRLREHSGIVRNDEIDGKFEFATYIGKALSVDALYFNTEIANAKPYNSKSMEKFAENTNINILKVTYTLPSEDGNTSRRLVQMEFHSAQCECHKEMGNNPFVTVENLGTPAEYIQRIKDSHNNN